MPTTRFHKRRATIAALFVPVVLQALPAIAGAAPAAAAPNGAFAAWADRFAEDWVRLNPQSATSTQYFSGSEQEALDRQLTPQTPAQRKKVVALAKTGVAQLDKFLAGPLSEEQRTSASVMRWSLANTVASEPYEDYSFVFNQFGGVQVGLVNFMTTTHPLRRAADVSSYLARLDQVGTRMDEALARSKAATAKGLIPPRFILERAQFQVDKFLEPAADKNVLVTTFAQRSEKLSDLAPDARDKAIADATRIVETKIRPAYRRVQAYLAELHPKTGDTAGISRLPNGAAAYQQALRTYTSTNLTAAEIHAIGLREVARIEGEMDRHLRALGYTEGSVEERMAKLDATFQPKADPDPRPELLQKYAGMVADAERRSAAIFNLMPRAPVEVRREPPLTEPSAAAHYTLPAPDGSRPGIFWVPMRGPSFDVIRMRSLSYHEAVPGHHFQLAIQQEQKDLPKFRAQRIFGGGSAHSEGWALYAERLAVEQGWYEGDIPGLLGALGSELFRARRLVVDTGLHTKGWTRQQAIDYGIGAQEVERYVAWPGQACAYMIGMLRIIDLREKAKRELGDKFALPAFHDVVLKNGSVPLDVLGEVIDLWIVVQKQA
ncbi:DUF885 domain-containing protein [Massilia sp. YIM B02763]|uniref:DUF885 domain-containing protein n=1 Tax=Massilia sp. YIM B02763 TaxID=3050130 RepID=UPI0025B71D3D|nr:DUF885 domain-containing protein [Massilia sp. YIM B02763]MDN4051963.1 DUF885 domain-containing protein [Massilia sp. YIM B02763]